MFGEREESEQGQQEDCFVSSKGRQGGRESGPYKWAVSPFLPSSNSHLIPSLIAPLSSLRSRMGHVALAALHSDPIRARVPCSKFRPAGR